MNILSIDPGLHGAWALFCDGLLPSVDDLPLVGKHIDVLTLGQVCEGLTGQPLAIVLEAQAAMPKQGVASSFHLGENYGLLHGALLTLASQEAAWSLHTVRPAVWKRALRLSADKERSREQAMRLWPALHPRLARKKDEGRAEALLLGHYWQQAQKEQI